jgi:hypothetical protein
VPLVLDPKSVPESVLKGLVRSLRADLAETEQLVRNPKGRVIDPASLLTAQELLESAREILTRSQQGDRASLASDANLAYAVMIAAIDLVKSHTDVPRVPPPRTSSPTSE